MRFPNFFQIALALLLLFTAANLSSAAALEEAKDFELKGIDGKTYTLSGLKGKVVLINFWATWCKYCIKENPSLDRLYKKFSNDEFIVLGISIDRSAMKVKNYLQKNSLSYPVLLDSKGEVFVRTYTVMGVPATFLINKEGFIVEKLMGKQNFDSNKFVKSINALL